MPTTIAHLRTHWREEALRRGISPRDVDLLLADVTGRSPAWVFAHGDEQLDPTLFESLIERRFAELKLAHYPLRFRRPVRFA